MDERPELATVPAGGRTDAVPQRPDAADGVGPAQPASPDPVTARRRLCRELRDARERAGYSQQQVSANLGWSFSKQTRVEAGKVSITTTDLRALLDLYGVRDRQRRDHLDTLARAARRQPWGAYRDVLSADDQAYLGCETAAVRLRQYDVALVPELLRTEGYAWEVIRALSPPDTPRRLLQRRLEVCLARQSILDRADPPELHFVIDEAALQRRAGAGRDQPMIMHGQVQRLHDLAERPGVSIQMLPLARGLLGGVAGSFALLDLPDGESVVYPSSGIGSATRAAAADPSWYMWAFESLAAASSPPRFLHTTLNTIIGESGSSAPQRQADNASTCS